MGDHLGMVVGLQGSCRFCLRNPQGSRLPRVPQFGPQQSAYGVLKSPGTPSRASVHRAFWQYPYLRAFSGVDTGVRGIKSDWYIYGIRAVYGRFAIWEPHQWWWTPKLQFFPGPFPQSCPWQARKLQARLEKYDRLSAWTFFFSLNVLSVWAPGHNSVPGNVTYVFYHNDGMLLHIFYEGKWVLPCLVWYLDIVLS